MPSSPHLSIVLAADGSALVVAGEIDATVAPVLMAAVEQHAPGELVLDMSGVTFIDSSGLALLLQLRDRQEERGSRITLRRPTSQVWRLLAITGLTNEFVIDAVAVSGAANS